MSVDPEALTTLLGSAALFAKCSNRELAVVAKHAEVSTFENGSTVVEHGGEGDAFFLVLEGAAEVRRDGEVLAELGPGDHFGELALLDPAPRAADVVATSDLTVACLQAAKFHLVLQAVPAIAPQLLAGLACEVRRSSVRAASQPRPGGDAWRW